MFLYKVSIDYKDFSFTDLMSACSFAEMAAQNQNDDYEVKITITTIPDQGEQDASHLNDETEN